MKASLLAAPPVVNTQANVQQIQGLNELKCFAVGVIDTAFFLN